MVISGVDKKEMARLVKRNQRKFNESMRVTKSFAQETDSISGNCNQDTVRKSS